MNYAQSVGVNTTTPDASAALDVSDTTKGLLIPRMTDAQRIAIPTPAKGLMVFQSNSPSGFYYFDGSSWIRLVTDLVDTTSLSNRINTKLTKTELTDTLNTITFAKNTTRDSIILNVNGRIYQVKDSVGQGFFKVSTADANHIIYSDMTNKGKNFIVNADSVNWKSLSEIKMMFIPSKSGAFRTGMVDNKSWDKDSIGGLSFASGYNTKAKGPNSIALGSNSTASGQTSTAIGSGTTASASYSTASGQFTTASGFASTAMGRNSTASASYSTAIGYYTTASSSNSTAMGDNTTASGTTSTAMGNGSTASGIDATAMGTYTKALGNTSTALGYQTTATGNYTTTMGANTKAKSYSEVSIGAYNDSLKAYNATTWKGDTNRLFTVGNGTASNNLKTAFVIQQNGYTGVNTRIADTQLHVKGGFKYVDGNQAAGKVLTSDSNGVAKWTTASGGFFKVSAADTNHIIYSDATKYGKNFIVNADSANFNTGNGTENKMMFIASKYGAFRAGRVNTKNWDKDSIGYNSFASGFNTKASGNYSTALGYYNTASGIYSTAMGYLNTAIANYSTAMGNSNTASGSSSTAMGQSTTASGEVSTAMGNYTTASGIFSTAIGRSTIASGNFSTAMGNYSTSSGSISTAFGNYTTAKSFNEMTIGAYNDTLIAYNAATWKGDTNRLFTVGNGISSSAMKTAFVIQQNGNVGVGSRKPMSTLEVGGAVAMPILVVTATSTLTLDNTHYTIVSNGSITTTLNLPTASTCTGRIYKIVNVGGTVYIPYTNYANTSITNVSAGSAVTIQSDGTIWRQIP